MKKVKKYWIYCDECEGRGNKRRKLRKKTRLKYQRLVDAFQKNSNEVIPPIRPKGDLRPCENCKGSGLVASQKFLDPNYMNYPHVAIIGGGIGGVALAVACLHRAIPFTLFERDDSFNDRSQGYGLTLQQASKAIKELGVFSLDEGVISTRHVVHTTDGSMIGEWGMRKWLKNESKRNKNRSNIHISRQSLRLELLKQLGSKTKIAWGHKFIDLKVTKDTSIDLKFEVDGEIKSSKADIVVGADGIRSAVRNILIDEKTSPLNYLGCIVILGICPLASLKNKNHELLDSATVFQTSNGNERIYIMPYSEDSVMWQLSFPMGEIDAKKLSFSGAETLKKEAVTRTQWHDPIPQIIRATEEKLISGYPVYDRKLLDSSLLENAGSVTLIGDAAHPMSPFKGQGANQALLDALSLAREITRSCNHQSNWREVGIRKNTLQKFEYEMLERSKIKVKGSADAAKFLHSKDVLEERDGPRGRSL